MKKEHRLYDPKEIVAKGDVKPEEISDKFSDFLTISLEYVLDSDKKADWVEASQDLYALFRNQIKNCDPKTWSSIQDAYDWRGDLQEMDDESRKIYQAYVLGKIAFAQEIVTHMTMKKPDDEILELLNSPKNQTFFNIMLNAKNANKELTIQEIHVELGGDIQEIATFIRKCRKFRLLKFREGGLGVVYNSLTDEAVYRYSPVY
jgi:hypothetical protein